jgi:hypothetical protein
VIEWGGGGGGLPRRVEPGPALAGGDGGGRLALRPGAPPLPHPAPLSPRPTPTRKASESPAPRPGRLTPVGPAGQRRIRVGSESGPLSPGPARRIRRHPSRRSPSPSSPSPAAGPGRARGHGKYRASTGPEPSRYGAARRIRVASERPRAGIRPDDSVTVSETGPGGQGFRVGPGWRPGPSPAREAPLSQARARPSRTRSA